MITTGSKYFFGLAGFALVAALVLGVASSGHNVGMNNLVGVISLGYKGDVGNQYGYAVLITLFGASLFLGVATSAFRDADPEAAAQFLQIDQVPEAAAPQGVSYWPILGAFAVGCVMIGFVAGSPLVVLGAAVGLIVAFEWGAKAWSERATGDPAVNRAIRNRILNPVEIPLIGFVGVAVFVLSVSRMLLALPKIGTYLLFGGVPVVILAIGTLVTLRPKVNRTLATIALLIAGVAVLAGGVIAAEAGPRKESDHHAGSIGVVHPVAPTSVRTDAGGRPA